ncbi:DUF2075 domain-containing protein [Candidatus Pacearchaeota archaeon]|nr:DUF2075 domain-containing protein [Candidatus Pacearchaeota archaeon]
MRMNFDSDGKLVSVDEPKLDLFPSKRKEEPIFEPVLEKEWSLYEQGNLLSPLLFSNGKTQEDVVKEVVDHIKQGVKLIFIHGVCGTGKSAIALNIARKLGRASIVVPVKGLQKQYEEDYTSRKYVTKNGRKMKIAMLTGRENHDSIINPGASCADPFLPENIALNEKNSEILRDYYYKNPYIMNKTEPEIKQLKRISVAPANPYWSPIAPAEIELPLKGAKKKRYKGLEGREFVFYHRKEGCSYYDQYQAYLDADVLIFNAAKYKIEVALDRKPATDVEIIDEADEFLDNFSTQHEINLTRLSGGLRLVVPEKVEAQEAVQTILELIKLEEKNKIALGVDEDQIFQLKDTKIEKIFELLIKNPDIESEVVLDETNYANKAIDAAYAFKGFFEDTYLTYRKDEKDLYANIVTTNLSKRFKEIVDKNRAIVLMSGTLHSQEVLKDIFGLEDFKIVEAETLGQGTIEILRTGKEFDCKYANFSSGKHSRVDYLKALSASMSKAKKPVLIHVNSFEDLPTEQEIQGNELFNLISKEKLKQLQGDDKEGRMISLFKAKLQDSLFTTKCSRGVDFPGDVCNSVIFTKYPNPNINGTFWKILQRTHKDYFWEFYKDKARREFLQRIYRALRSKDDHVYVLSPDSRVLDAVRDLQISS